MTAFQHWCHMPDVATEASQTSDMHLSKGKCALSTLIFQKFSGGIAPRPPYWGGATAPLPRPHPVSSSIDGPLFAPLPVIPGDATVCIAAHCVFKPFL